MTILITGGAGYIGSHMVYALLDQGQDLVVLDNLSTGFRSAVPTDVPFIVGDVGDASLVSNVISKHGIEAIIHFAASTVVPESVSQPLWYYKNNTANTRTLIETAIAGAVKYFVFSSTAAVYGNPSSTPVDENAPTLPISPYGKSKLMSESMLQDAASADKVKYAILRYFNVAGADPTLRTGQSTKNATHLIKVAVQAALGLRPYLEVFGSDYPTPDGSCVRDFIHVSDLVDAHWTALSSLEGGNESTIVNCGYGRGHSVFEVIEAVKRVSRRKFSTVLRDRRRGDPARVIADVSKIRRQFGWTPVYDDLDTIVSHALAWEEKASKKGHREPSSA